MIGIFLYKCKPGLSGGRGGSTTVPNYITAKKNMFFNRTEIYFDFFYWYQTNDK